MNESKHPELHQFMNNLREAGMHYEQVIEQGFTFAQELQWSSVLTSQKQANVSVPIQKWVVMQEASLMIRDVSEELELSLTHQREAYEKAMWRAR